MLTMTAAMAQHTPIVDPDTECPGLCDMSVSLPDPVLCITIPMSGVGSECLTDPETPCLAIWPSGAFAGMPTWNLNIYGEVGGDPPEWAVTAIVEDDPLSVILPTSGTWDFCAMLDQVVCSLAPFYSLADEVELFGNMLLCGNMDINGELNDCLDLTVTGNGIPDAYEFAIVGGVLNNSSHALYGDVTAAMQTNLDAICDLLIAALSNVEISAGSFLDVRKVAYQSAPWLIPGLGGVLAAAAVLDDPLTNAALDELLGLLADIGITPPAGGIASICDGVAACGPEGDVSGNGFTNREIYEWFIQVNPTMTADEYAVLALDPATVVPANVAISGASGNVGEDITLTVDVSNVAAGYSAASYTWYKWEFIATDLCKNPPDCDEFCDRYDWVVITGEEGSSLTIPAVDLTADGAKYAVDVAMDDGTKAVNGTIMAQATLVVTDLAGVPVGGALGLTLLAGACALAGAVGIRRRK